MTKPAARFSDLTGHGGTIVGGYPTVLIGGLPAARLGDSHLCPLFDGPKPHLGGVIVTGSATVLIGGASAARVGDFCGCPSVGTVGVGAPPVVGAPPRSVTSSGKSDKAYFKDNSARESHAEYTVSDADKDGDFDSVQAEAYGIKVENTGDVDFLGQEVGAEHKLKIDYGEAKASAHGSDYGAGASASAEVGGLKQSIKLWHGEDTDNGANPNSSVLGEWDAMHAEAKGDILVGDDGQRIGLGFLGKAGAEAVAGKVVGTTRIDAFGILDHFGLSLEVGAEVGADAASVGAGAGAHVYYDRADQRMKIGVLGKVALLLGFEGKLDMSFGKKRPPGGGTPGTGAGGIPNPIALGEMTVLIGG